MHVLVRGRKNHAFEVLGAGFHELSSSVSQLYLRNYVYYFFNSSKKLMLRLLFYIGCTE